MRSCDLFFSADWETELGVCAWETLCYLAASGIGFRTPVASLSCRLPLAIIQTRHVLTVSNYSLAPYERRVIELLRNSRDKRARKLAKKRVRQPHHPIVVSTPITNNHPARYLRPCQEEGRRAPARHRRVPPDRRLSLTRRTPGGLEEDVQWGKNKKVWGRGFSRGLAWNIFCRFPFSSGFSEQGAHEICCHEIYLMKTGRNCC